MKARLRAVIAGRPVTESELRKLFEQGRACSLIVNGELEHTERRLAELSGDPAGSFVEIAAAFRRVTALHDDLHELHALLAELAEHAHAYRGAWVAETTGPAGAPAR